MKKVLVNEGLLRQVLDALEAADKRDGVYSYRCEINALHALFDAPVQECGYDETTGSCTRNPCCAVAPVQEPEISDAQASLLASALGECILASGIVGKDKDGFSGPELLMFAEDLKQMLERSRQPAQEPVVWNQVQVCTWIGNQLMTQPSMFERNAVCKFVRSLGRNEKLAKYFPAPQAQQPAQAPVTKITLNDGKYLQLSEIPGWSRKVWCLHQQSGAFTRILDTFETGFVEAALRYAQQPRKAVKLTEAEIHNADPMPHGMSDAHRMAFGQAIETAVLKKSGLES